MIRVRGSNRVSKMAIQRRSEPVGNLRESLACRMQLIAPKAIVGQGALGLDQMEVVPGVGRKIYQ